MLVFVLNSKVSVGVVVDDDPAGTEFARLAPCINVGPLLEPKY